MSDRFVEFIRQRDYKMVKELGQGACGKTVLLHDDEIDEYFVCKKYVPYEEDRRKELYANFVREIKLLHQLFHRNVVRIYNYYLYPDKFTGYILMEYIEGLQLDKYLSKAPERVNELFSQAIEAFAYLESVGVLHRDIRPPNVLVRDDGTLKVIDLGFGKKIVGSDDFDKSISLNLWCGAPQEFGSNRYDYGTEVYFVGKLFEQILYDNAIDQFDHYDLLRGMCQHDDLLRIGSFREVATRLHAEGFTEIDFTEQEKDWYQTFSACLRSHVTKLEQGATYGDDLDRIGDQLGAAYRALMLEETAPTAAPIVRCFIHGAFYHKREGFPVSAIRDFTRLIRGCSPAKARIVLANICTTLDTVPRYQETKPEDEDIPF